MHRHMPLNTDTEEVTVTMWHFIKGRSKAMGFSPKFQTYRLLYMLTMVALTLLLIVLMS